MFTRCAWGQYCYQNNKKKYLKLTSRNHHHLKEFPTLYLLTLLKPINWRKFELHDMFFFFIFEFLITFLISEAFRNSYTTRAPTKMFVFTTQFFVLVLRYAITLNRDVINEWLTTVHLKNWMCVQCSAVVGIQSTPFWHKNLNCFFLRRFGQTWIYLD